MDEGIVHTYKERVTDMFIKQLKEIYERVKIIEIEDCNEIDFEKWVWKYRKTGLWNFLRALPYVLEAELEIEYTNLNLEFNKISGKYVLFIKVAIEKADYSKTRKKIKKLIKRQNLPSDCNIDIFIF